MKKTHTWTFARKTLLVFLILTIVSSIIALFVRNTITGKIADLAKLTTHADQNQSKPEHVLMLLHLAENDFQESLLTPNSQKGVDYKTKLLLAFNQIDTLLKENIDTTQLPAGQKNNIKIWYQEKLKLSDELLALKHSFDSLLTFYSGFNSALDDNLNKSNVVNTPQIKETTTRQVQPEHKKGLFGRIREAISNKNAGSTVEITHTKSTNTTDPTTQKILAQNKSAYVKKLQQLQQQNVRLLGMQRKLLTLNTNINNELEQIISELKDINYHIADEFKNIAFKNYQETTELLNEFYLAALFLVLLFATLLIIFIIQLTKAELSVKAENHQSINRAEEKIAALIKKIELNEDNRSPVKMEELKTIVQLAVANNPAFMIKFNEYDPEFCKRLLCRAPNLVASETEFCALLRLNFETKEIARYTNISVRAVEGKKYRIRRKLDIPSDQDINVWMTNL